MMKLQDIRIKPKLTAILLFTGIVPLVIVGLFIGEMSVKSYLKQSFNTLETVQEIRKKQILQAMKERGAYLDVMAGRKQIVDMSAALVAYEQRSKAVELGPFQHRTKEYERLVSGAAKTVREALAAYGFHDMMLVSPATGNVLFSSSGSDVVGASLAHGSLKDSGPAKVWRKVARTEGKVLVDFDPYGPYGGAETAFAGRPVVDSSGILQAVLIVAITPDFINKIMDSRQGLGTSGEAYLISWDRTSDIYEFRSDIQTLGGGAYVVGSALEPLEYWRDAVKDDSQAHKIYIDSVGMEVLIAYDKVSIGGLEWYLISKIDKQEVTAPVREMIVNSSLVGAVLMVLIGLGAYVFARGFSRPIMDGSRFAEAISSGDYEGEIVLDRGDELGILATSLTDMARNLRHTDWMNKGKEGLDDSMRGEHAPIEVAKRFIGHMAKHMDAVLGAVYFHRDGELSLKAGYSFTDRSGDYTDLKVGEGIVGQAAAEREMLVYTKVSGNVPVVDYGAGEEAPKYFMAVPLEFEEELLAVFLLGSHEPFDELKRQFVRDNAANIGVMLNVARSRRVIQKLLDASHEQQERLRLNNEELERQAMALKESESELQAQQEELRVTNEELEEQTNALKESQAELQAQQEELRVTNEELEERTDALERQRESIKRKNATLVKTKEELRQKAEDLAVASKYKSEFLANMSHELRTPLNSILILSQLLAGNKEGRLSAKQVESAKAINSSGADLLSLIDEILDLSKIEAGRVELLIENVPLAHIVEDLDRVFRDVAKDKGVGFQINVADGLGDTIGTDSQRLQQVLRNLLTNAFKFTTKGTVSLDIARPKEHLVPSGALGAEHYVAFSVRDEGIGIPKDKQAAIFEAFKQADGSTSRKYGGTGLGLSISRELAGLLGGTIHLESEEGNGSMFIVVLPVRHTGAPMTPTIAQPAAPASRQDAVPPQREEKAQDAVAEEDDLEGVPAVGEEEQCELPDPDNTVQDDRKSIVEGDRVLLIIEDDLQFSQVMRDFAHERGFKCLIAHEGETGLHYADYYKPSAIVLDIGLPGIDGWTVMERLKGDSELRHIPVHFMSAADSSLDAMRMGAVGFLSKPVSMEKVEDAFARIESIVNRPVRKLLVVEDDPVQRDSIRELIGNGDVETVTVATGEAAFIELVQGGFECMVLDLGLQDMSGFDLLEKIRRSEECSQVPVIIYTGRDLTVEENEKLRAYTESIIIKGAKSPERLLEETALFLHRVEADLPKDKQKMLKMVHQQKETVLQGKKVMIVDDDMRNVFALTGILEEQGLDVIAARNGKECVDKLSDNGVDMVLMDIMMPVMDGYEAMRAIRGDLRMKQLPIIALTAKAMKGDRSKCIEAGANDYMAKPVNTDKLLSMLKVWLYS